METKSLGFCNLLIKRVGGSISYESVKQFVLRRYPCLVNQISKDGLFSEDLEVIGNNLVVLGWIEVKKPSKKKTADQSPLHEAIEWKENLKNGRVINQGITAAGAGTWLDILDHSSNDQTAFVEETMESLLKHIEIKRKKFLFALSDNLSFREMILEMLAVSVLCSRYAYRHKDLRFLNTAFKINDWLFSKLKWKKNGKPLILFLIALTEQEKSAQELLK